jgi:hypothetical protein
VKKQRKRKQSRANAAPSSAAASPPTSDVSERVTWSSSGSIERAIKRVESTREGAFGAWSSSPVVRALLLPFTGLGALELIRLLSM